MKCQPLLLVLFFIVFLYRLTGQNLIHIPEDALTLSDAVQLAQNGDTIYLSPGIYTDSVHVKNKQVVFLGAPDGGSVLSPGENGRSFVLQNADVEFKYLRFDDFELQSPPPNFAIDASYADVKIHHCEFSSIFSPVYVLWGSLEMHHSILSNNRNGKCILLNGGTFLLHNNLFYGLRTTPISINRAHGAFFNNTVIGSTPNQYRGMIINSDSISHIYNNIISGFGIGIHLIATDSAEFNALRIYHNNIYDGLAPYWYEYNESLSLPIYSGALVPNPGTGELSVAPAFVDSAAHDYALQATSLCIDSGVDVYPFPVLYDLAGNDRIVGASPDLGAYEYTSVVNSMVGVESIQTPVQVYPNPANDHTWIEFNEAFTGNIEVMDISGKLRKHLQLVNRSNVRIQLPPQKGLYLIRISGNNSLITKRVIKL